MHVNIAIHTAETIPAQKHLCLKIQLSSFAVPPLHPPISPSINTPKQTTMADTPSSNSPSRSSTPSNARFTSKGHTAEDLLKEQTVGLVHLSDFRKRRAEALEQTEKASRDGTPVASGATTPDGR